MGTSGHTPLPRAYALWRCSMHSLSQRVLLTGGGECRASTRTTIRVGVWWASFSFIIAYVFSQSIKVSTVALFVDIYRRSKKMHAHVCESHDYSECLVQCFLKRWSDSHSSLADSSSINALQREDVCTPHRHSPNRKFAKPVRSVSGLRMSAYETARVAIDGPQRELIWKCLADPRSQMLIQKLKYGHFLHKVTRNLNKSGQNMTRFATTIIPNVFAACYPMAAPVPLMMFVYSDRDAYENSISMCFHVFPHCLRKVTPCTVTYLWQHKCLTHKDDWFCVNRCVVSFLGSMWVLADCHCDPVRARRLSNSISKSVLKMYEFDQNGTVFNKMKFFLDSGPQWIILSIRQTT